MVMNRANPVVRARRGFTLVELIVASVVAAVITGATTTAVSQMLRVRARSAANHQAYARADAAATRIALDVAGAARHHDLLFTKVAVADSGLAGEPQDELLLLTRSLRPVRAREDNPEGGEYEVQFRVAPIGAEGGPTALWRRCDPGFDPAVDAGGIATPIVDGIVSLSIQASDGLDWFDAWDSDSDGMPHGLRVTVTARSDDGSTAASARRVIALDRTPLPPVTAEADSTDTGSGSTPTGGTTGTTTGGGGTR